MQIEDVRTGKHKGLHGTHGWGLYKKFPWCIKVFSTYHNIDKSGVDGLVILQQWVEDNLDYTPLTTYGRFYFKTEADAIAFKLRWG